MTKRRVLSKFDPSLKTCIECFTAVHNAVKFRPVCNFQFYRTEKD